MRGERTGAARSELRPALASLHKHSPCGRIRLRVARRSSERRRLMYEQLKNPPLVEALLEIRWRLPSVENMPLVDPAYPVVVGLLYDRVMDQYRFQETAPEAHLLPPEVLSYRAMHRFRVGEGQWPLVQIGPGVAVLNFTTSYTWDRFRRAATVFIEKLNDAYRVATKRIPQLTRVTLRYINSLEFRFEEQNVLDFMRDKLHIACAIPREMVTPDTVAGPPASVRFEVRYPLTRPDALGILNVRRGTRADKAALVWELLVVSADRQVPDLDELPQWLSDAHGVVEPWFFRLIEGDLYRLFQGGD